LKPGDGGADISEKRAASGSKGGKATRLLVASSATVCASVPLA